MKTRNTFSKALSLGALIGIMVAIIGLATRVSAYREVDAKPEFGMGMITLIPGQNARLNAVNVDNGIRPCRVELAFYDSNGRQIGETQRANLATGQAISSDVFGARTPGFDGALQVRGEVRGFADADGTKNDCTVIPTLEVFDQQTKGTLFMHPGVIKGFNPQPDPPGIEAQQ